MSQIAPQTDSQVQKDRYSKDVPWYYKEIGTRFSPAFRDLLENYSHLPPEEVIPHVHEIRDRAWACKPFPCLGTFGFLNLSITGHPNYNRIVSFLTESQSQRTLLDLGCCFAQDVRKLVHDGVPSENLYACDIEQEFLDLSYDLFRDRDKMKAHLFVANVFEEEGGGVQSSALDDLHGKIDVVYAGSFLHLFSWDDQLKVCKRIIKLLKAQKGSTVYGRQVGNLNAQEAQRRSSFLNQNSKGVWWHNVDSFRRLWDVAGRETGTKWHTWAELDVAEGMGPGHWAEEGTRRLRFEVLRVE